MNCNCPTTTVGAQVHAGDEEDEQSKPHARVTDSHGFDDDGGGLVGKSMFVGGLKGRRSSSSALGHNLTRLVVDLLHAGWWPCHASLPLFWPWGGLID